MTAVVYIPLSCVKLETSGWMQINKVSPKVIADDNCFTLTDAVGLCHILWLAIVSNCYCMEVQCQKKCSQCFAYGIISRTWANLDRRGITPNSLFKRGQHIYSL